MDIPSKQPVHYVHKVRMLLQCITFQSRHWSMLPLGPTSVLG